MSKEAEDKKRLKVIAKVQVTSAFDQWWESNLEDVIPFPPKQIISAVVDNGGLYLIYWYYSEPSY